MDKRHKTFESQIKSMNKDSIARHEQLTQKQKNTTCYNILRNISSLGKERFKKMGIIPEVNDGS